MGSTLTVPGTDVNYRRLGRTGWAISEVSFGAWGIGGDVWGATDDQVSIRALQEVMRVEQSESESELKREARVEVMA